MSDDEEATCPVCEQEEYDCDCVECFVCGKVKLSSEFYYDDSCNDCCGNCNHPKDACTCCRTCEMPIEECDCSAHVGSMPKPPWEKRGHSIQEVKGHTYKYNSIWPELDQSRNPLTDAADFYLLEAVANGVPFGPIRGVNYTKAYFFADKHGLTPEEILDQIALTLDKRQSQYDKLMLTAEQKLIQHIRTILPVYWAYSHIAISGEARHHYAIGGRVLPNAREKTWSAWRKVYEKLGPESINDLRILLQDMGGDYSDYGGTTWATAAKLLYDYETNKLGPVDIINKKMFIDRVFTLTHNNGSFLNKVSWYGADVERLQRLLDAHAAKNPDWGRLLMKASNDVVVLWSNWEELLGEKIEVPKPINVCVSCYGVDGHTPHCYRPNGSWSSVKIKPDEYRYIECKDSIVCWDKKGKWIPSAIKTVTISKWEEGHGGYKPMFTKDVTPEGVTNGITKALKDGYYQFDFNNNNASILNIEFHQLKFDGKNIDIQATLRARADMYK